MKHSSFLSKWKEIKTGEEKNKAEIDERTLFTDVGEKPLTQRQLNLYNYFLFIKKRLEGIKAKEILEVGCGRGTMSLFLSKYLNYRVSLLDNVPEALDLAREEFKKHGQTASFYVGDALNIDIGEKRFDGVVSIGLAEHIDDAEKLFSEQFKVLKDGGVMISLNIPAKVSIQSLNSVMRFFKKMFGKYKEGLRKDYYRNSLKPNDYKRIARRVGFRDVEVIHVCPFPIFTPIQLETDKKITKIYKLILKVKSIFQKYPYKTNYLFSQGHFLIGYKNARQN